MERKTTTGKKWLINSVYHNLFPFFIFILFIIIFFGRLFYPQNSLFMIPDFGQSDVLHFHLPLKEILSRSLKNREFPHWTPLLSGGFPLLAEGQIGTFYLPNLLFFRFMPTIIAYNLNLAISFLLLALGTYLFTRKLKLSVLIATYVALIFTFSGFFSVHLNHYDIIQTASLMPLLFWAAYILWLKPSLKSAVLFSFLLSQQIFAGYVNIVFVTLVGIIIFWITLSVSVISLKRLLIISGSFILTFLLAAIQLLPTIELWLLSTRRTGLDFTTVTDFPYPAKHLLTFFNPYLFGSPANGSYPLHNIDWGIFWENTAYIGLIPLVLAVLSIVLIKKKSVKILFILLIASLLLVLGKNSPVYFLFSILPFNFFRVPSRFLLLSTFSLSLMSGIMLENIIKKLHSFYHYKILIPILVIILIIVFVIDEFSFSFKYPPLSPYNWWQNKPEIIDKFVINPQRVKTYGSESAWNDIFLKKGWQNIENYLKFKNSLFPNYNVLFNINQASINIGGLVPRRNQIWRTLIEDRFYNEKEKSILLKPSSLNSLNIWGVDTIISAYPISVESWKMINSIKSDDNINYFIYQNKNAREKAYFADQLIKVDTIEDFYQKLTQVKSTVNSVYYEDDLDLKITVPNKNSIEPKSLNPLQEEYQVQTDADALLVFNRSHYPGWAAFLNGIKVQVLTVNLNQPAVIIPKGHHQLKLVFESDIFNFGKKITALTFFITFLAVFLDSLSFPHKFVKLRRLFSHLWRKGSS